MPTKPTKPTGNPRGRPRGMLGRIQLILGAAPCDDCASAQHCLNNLVACSDFHLYVNEGAVIVKDRFPTKYYYRLIYRSRDKPLHARKSDAIKPLREDEE